MPKHFIWAVTVCTILLLYPASTAYSAKKATPQKTSAIASVKAYMDYQIKFAQLQQRLDRAWFDNNPQVQAIEQELKHHEYHSNYGNYFGSYGNITRDWLYKMEAFHQQHRDILHTHFQKVVSLHDQRKLGTLPWKEYQQFEAGVGRFEQNQQQAAQLVTQQLGIILEGARRFANTPLHLPAQQDENIHRQINQILSQAKQVTPQLLALTEKNLFTVQEPGSCNFTPLNPPPSSADQLKNALDELNNKYRGMP